MREGERGEQTSKSEIIADQKEKKEVAKKEIKMMVIMIMKDVLNVLMIMRRMRMKEHCH